MRVDSVQDGGVEDAAASDPSAKAGSGGARDVAPPSAAGASGQVSVATAGSGGSLVAVAGSGGGMAGAPATLDAGVVPEPDASAEAGITAACTAGESRCEGKRVMDCSGGEWTVGADCPFACRDGACGGVCMPGSKQCTLNVQQLCGDDGEWMDGTVCPNVCDRGECTGRCSPSSLQCSSKLLQRCDDTGAWVEQQTCPFVCEEGACVGVCTPSTVECSNGAINTCDEHGRWIAGTACPNLCTAGRCTGQCRPGMQDCLLTVPRRCNDQGMWLSGEIEARACNAVCTPGETKCVDQWQETCNVTGTRWTRSATPSTACGACAIDATRCDNARTMKQVCTSQGVWRDVGVAKMCGAQCDPGATGCGGYVSAGVEGSCEAALTSCWFSWTIEGVVHQRLCDEGGRWTRVDCPLACTVGAGEFMGTTATGCLAQGGRGACVTSGNCP